MKMAVAHLYPARLNPWPRAESDLSRAKNARQHNIAPGFKLTISLQSDPPAQAIHHQRLVRLGNAKLERQSGMFDGALWTRPRAAVIAADDDQVSVGFGDTCRDSSYTRFRDEFHADPRVWIAILQMEDQLRQVFD